MKTSKELQHVMMLSAFQSFEGVAKDDKIARYLEVYSIQVYSIKYTEGTDPTPQT